MKSPEGKRMIVNDNVGKKLTTLLETHPNMIYYNDPQYLIIRDMKEAPFLNDLLVKLETIDPKDKTAGISFSNEACRQIFLHHKKEYKKYSKLDIECHPNSYYLPVHGLTYFPTDNLEITI